MKIAVSLLAGLLALTSAQAFAAEDANRTISSVGVQGLGYVQFKEGVSQPCQFGTIYLPDLSQYNARGMLAVLLAAQSNGLQVTVTYDINGSGFCTASKVQTQ